jgi:hypothetical protein
MVLHVQRRVKQNKWQPGFNSLVGLGEPLCTYGSRLISDAT